MEDQWAQVGVAVFKQLALMVGIFVVLTLVIIITFKRMVQNAVFCEFIEFGQSSFELLKIRNGKEVESSHGVYQLTDDIILEAQWPQGVPAFLTETVRHLKYSKGNEIPLIMPEMGEVKMTAALTLSRDKANRAVLEVAAKELSQASKEDTGIAAHGPLIFATGIILLILIGGGKLIYDKIELIAAAVGS